MKRLSILFLSFATIILFLSSCATQQQPVKGVESSVSEEGDIKKVKITANAANVRSGCDAGSPVLQSTSQNDTLDVVSQVENWYAVKLPENQIGFVSADQCTPIVADTNTNTNTAAGTQNNQVAALTTENQDSTDGKGTSNTPNGNEPDNTPATTPEDTNATGTTNQQKNTAKTNNNQASLSDEENQMVKLVNEARAQNNLPALQIDIELANVARIKAQDMIDNNYFSHNSPTYGSPFDMLKDFGVEYVKAGENIAGNQSVEQAEEALMNSPGHRANILGEEYTHIGIGIKDGGQYGKMFSQMFISKPQ